ncbi:MAG TPA: type II toxin-antitoxin system HicA family toxin [Firmicutes bacterium]|nr:type II toxin-antitoxin system HicA family toxin [Bacillota bacterium]HHY99053.1 type II toxin-antitoxin system HicA family toxin [Bacillota bacterium]
MKIPRNVSGEQLAQLLTLYGYRITRQTGSHMRLTTILRGEHHVTIPRHNPLRIGTLSGVLSDVAVHLKVSKEELVRELFKGYQASSKK